MENKYFTPDIEDISVGCEFEMDDTWGGWKKLTLTKDLLAHPMIGLGSGNERSPWYHKIRVPYLTKEQIEAEGWKPEKSYFRKNNLYLFFENNELEIEFGEPFTWDASDSDVRYKGECKDINTFRKIIKLLKI
jgi:hypothetical protein